MKRQQPEPPPPAPAATPLQCKQWWDQVATEIAAIEAWAETYMIGDVLDEAAASEILESLTAAKVAADCVFGAYHRVTKTARHLPQPAAQTAQTAQQPSYG
jgi:hypothetical protein